MKLLWTAKHQAGLYVYLLIKGNVHVRITYIKWDKMKLPFRQNFT